jgi:hypothetical protein
MNNKIRDKLWSISMYAKNFPEDFIVVPVLDVVEMLEDLK